MCLCSLTSVLPPSQLARTPSPVRNLTATIFFDRNQGKIFANLSWIGPERPYGKIDHYKIVLSSPRTESLIASTTVNVKVCMLYSHCTTPSTGNDIHGHLPYEEEYLPPHPQGTAAAQNMNLVVETHIVSDLTEDEYFNFSVRMHAS